MNAQHWKYWIHTNKNQPFTQRVFKDIKNPTKGEMKTYSLKEMKNGTIRD